MDFVEGRYQLAFRGLPDRVLLLAPDLTIVDATDAYCAATHLSRDAAAGRPLFEVFPDDPRDPVATGVSNLRLSLEAALRTGKTQKLDVQRYPVRRGGAEGAFEERFWTATNTPIPGPDGKIAFIAHRVEDLTHLVRLQQAHQQEREVIADQLELARENAELYARSEKVRHDAEEQRARLRRLLGEAPAAIALIRGPEHVFELANARYCELLGRHDLVGKPGRLALPELVPQGIWDLLDRVYRTGETFHGKEFPARLDRRGDGRLEQGYFNFTAQALRDGSGAVEGILIFAVEVTAQVVARQALEAILERVPVPLLLLEPGTARVLFSNHAADGLWGEPFPRAGSPADYAQFEISDLGGRKLSVEEHPAVRAARGEALSDVEVELRRGGRTTSLQIDSASVPELPGHPAVTVLSFQDVTRLREAVRTREDFLSIASHELNTPLTPLKLQLGTLLAQELPDKLRKRVETADRQVNRLARLVTEILEVSRITAGRLTMHPEQVDVAGLLREVIARMGESHAPIALEASDGIRAFVDPLRLEQVAMNLLSNALKYGEGKPVEVSVAEDSDRVAIRVRDHGIGIASEMQQRIFDRFERAVSARHYGGFGLGLWIVRQIVEAAAGTVQVESAPGRGSLFTVSLPKPA